MSTSLRLRWLTSSFSVTLTLTLLSFVPASAGATLSCIMNVPNCPNHPTYNGVFSDNYENSQNNQDRCLQRATDYYYWCGTKTPDTATFIDNGAVVKTMTFPPTGNTACIMNVPNCPKHTNSAGTFADDYENAGSDQTRCLQRASDYYYWCGTKTPDTASYFVNNLSVQTKTYPIVGISITPSMPLAQITTLVNNSPAGSTFQFAAGTYRGLSLNIPKNGDIFLGGSGVILNGSQVLSSFSQQNTLWVAKGPTTPETLYDNSSNFPICTGKNADGTAYTIGCLGSRDLFLDDQPLWRVATLAEVAPGKWYFNPTLNMIYIGNNPAGHTVEISVTPNAFEGTSVSDVTIQGFTIEKYANVYQDSAVGCLGNASLNAANSNGCSTIKATTPAANWTVQSNLFTLNHYAGFEFHRYCSGLTLNGNQFYMNGGQGIAGNKSDSVTVSHNSISNNNYVGYNPGWQAGGFKASNSSNLVVEGNTIFGNNGPGFWCDIDCSGATITQNNIYNNTTAGIFYEISTGATITNNTVERNGTSLADCPVSNSRKGCPQVALSSSNLSSVSHNTTIVNSEFGNGIVIFQENRGTGCLYDGTFNSRQATSDSVTSNSTQFLGSVGLAGAVEYDGLIMAFANIFNLNTYIVNSGDNADHWEWRNGISSWSQLQSQGQELSGKLEN